MKTVFLNLPYQTLFSVTTDSENLIKMLTASYGRYAVYSSERSDTVPITVQKVGDTYRVITPESDFCTDYPFIDIDRYIFDRKQYDPTVFALHGAAVARAEKSYAFLAATHSGKTTLASYLTANGFDYITDDCILLDRASLSIHPCATPLHLRAGGIEVLKKYNSLPPDIKRLFDPPHTERFVYDPPNVAPTAYPVEKIFFIERTESTNCTVPMTANEKIAAFMRSPITDYAVNADYLRFIAFLARQNCCKLYYSDMSYVKELISRE